MTKRYRLLFVDDEERVLRSLKSVFRRDYDVYVAGGGDEALEILAQQQIDVIISDQRMPNMTGSELLAEVRKQYPNTMRLLLTGYVDKLAIIDTINEGEIFRYISKPWDIDDIRETVALAAKASECQVPVEPEVAIASAVAQFPTQVEDAQLKESVSKLPASEKTAFVLMDKDQSVRYSIRDISRRIGFSVYSASSYTQAVRMFAVRPDVGVAIISIESNPQETLEALNLFKRHRPDLSVIALADQTDANVAIELINKGQVFRYLQKPVDSQEFECAVLSAIRRHHMLKDVNVLNQRYVVNAWTNPATAGIQKLKQFFSQSA